MLVVSVKMPYKRQTPSSRPDPRLDSLGERYPLLFRLHSLRPGGCDILDSIVDVFGLFRPLPLSSQRFFGLVELRLLLLFLLFSLHPSCLADLLHLPGLDHLGLDLAILIRLDHGQYRAHALLFVRRHTLALPLVKQSVYAARTALPCRPQKLCPSSFL